jgi:hypothetical protein
MFNCHMAEILLMASRVVGNLNEEFSERMLEIGRGFDIALIASSHYASIGILGGYILWDTEDENDGDNQTEESIEAHVRGQLTDLATAMQVFLPVVEMGMCEAPHVALKPNQLYRFVVMSSCDMCKKIAALAALDIPVKTAVPRSNAEKETTHEA